MPRKQKQPKKSKKLVDKFRLSLVVTSFLFFSCATGGSQSGPLIPMCISDPENQGFQCADKDQTSYFLPFEKSGDLVATDLDSFKVLIDWCHANK